MSDLFYINFYGSVGLEIAIQNGSSFTASKPSIPGDSSNCYLGNFDGSGRSGIMCGGVYGTSTGTGFGNFVTLNLGGKIGKQRLNSVGGTPNPCLVMDVNGDGRDDLVCGDPPYWTPPPDPYPSPSTNWYVYLATGNAFTYQLWQGPAGGWSITTDCVAGDFNGDGLKDLACSWNANSSTWNVLLSTGTGWSLQTWTNGPLPQVQGYPGGTCQSVNAGQNCPNPCVVGDFDGDGIDDIACNAVKGQWSIGFGGGNAGFKRNAVNWAGFAGVLPGTPSEDCVVTDIFGTGRAGILCLAGGDATSTSWSYDASTGTGFTSTIFSTSWSLAGPGSNGAPEANTSQICVVADFNGDGIKDIACDPLGNGSWLMGLSARPTP